MSTVPELIAKMIGQQISHINTMFPAVVTEVNTYTCDVKPKFYYEIEKRGQKFPRDFPILRDVPVVWPKGGKSVIKMPIMVDDVVLVGCSQVSLSKMLIDLTEVKADTSTKFDMKDAFILGGIVPTNNLEDIIYDGADYKIPTAPIIMSDGPICLGAPNVLFGRGSLPGVMVQGVNLYNEYKRVQRQHIHAEDMVAPATGGASSVEAGIAFTWEFSDGLTESILCKVDIPANFDLDVDPKLVLYWASTVTLGNCKWQIGHLMRSVNEAINALVDGNITTVVTPSFTSVGLVESSIILDKSLFTGTDKLALLKISRLGADPEDTLIGNTYLVSVVFKYTINRLGE